MYLEQIGNDDHRYRLRFSDGTIHHGITNSSSHLCLILLIYEGHVKEEVFADRLRVRSANTGISIDDLIEEEFELYDDFEWQPASYYTELFENDQFIMWMMAREKLLDSDEHKIPVGTA